MNARWSRRHFLAGMGGAGAALVPMLHAEGAAAAGRFPRRILIAVTSNGTIQDQFWPKAGASGEILFPEDSPERPSITAPLAPFKDDLLFLKGIDMTSAKDDASVHGGHDNFVHMLVGGARAHQGPRGDHNLGVAATGAGDLSVDQYVVKSTLPPTRFQSLVLGVMVQWGALHQARISWLGDNRPVTPQEDPYKLFDQLFGGRGLPPGELERLRRQRRSVLDVVRRQLEGYAGALGAEDREKLGGHLEAVRGLERQLDPRSHAGLACAAPTTPDGERLDLKKTPNYPAVGRLQMDAAVAAMACDLTRVVTLQWSNSCNNNVVFSWLGDEFVSKGDEFGNREHHDITHVARRSADHTRRKCLAERWYIEQFAYLLGKLKSVKEGDGTMLDHTLVLWANNMHDGAAHSHGPHLPWVMAGARGFLRTGRFVDLGKEAVAHQRVLASLCEYMGADPAGFGLPKYNTGPLSLLRG